MKKTETKVLKLLKKYNLKEIEKLYLEGQTMKKAFGGCLKCYGKGYATEMVGKTKAFGDFKITTKVIRKPHIQINFCSCERGKQLKELFKKKEEENV